MSRRSTMQRTVEEIAFADSTYWGDGWQFAESLQTKARAALRERDAEDPRATLFTHSYRLRSGQRVRHTHVVQP
jgi:hypothetical protein